MYSSTGLDQLAAALAAAQGRFDTIRADSLARIRRKTGEEAYSYSYASLRSVLDAIRQPLTENGLALLQSPRVDLPTSMVSVETMLVHTSGQWVACELASPVDLNDIKALGSAISYLRRYGLVSLLALAWDDDDGTRASESAAVAEESATVAEKHAYQHWSLDSNNRRRFHAERDRIMRQYNLTADWSLIKREALGVGSITEYPGTLDDALAAIAAWAEEQAKKLGGG